MRPKSQPRDRPERAWVPYLVLGAALLLTASATYSSSVLFRTRDQLQFQNAIEHTKESVQRRIAIYIDMLVLGSALFAAEDEIARRDFRNYVERLRINQRYPGIQGVGFTLRVPPAERERLAIRMREDGFPEFAIWPEYEREEYHAIVFLEPLDRRNLRAIGYDMFEEDVRRAAMERARDSGQPAASGKVTLVQEIDKQHIQPGFLIYVPVYRGGVTPATVEQRRRDLVGFVYSPFRTTDLLQGIFSPAGKPTVDFAVFDGSDPDPGHLLYLWRSSGTNTPFQHQATIDVAGRPWTLTFAPGASLAATSGGIIVPFLAGGGLLISLVLFWLTSAQARAQSAAEKHAADLRQSQSELKASEKQARALADLAQASEELHRMITQTAADAILTVDDDGTICAVNPATETIFGYSSPELAGQPLPFLMSDRRPAQRATLEAFLASTPAKPSRTGIELLARHKSGREFPVEISFGRSIRKDQRFSTAIIRDISSRKQAEEAALFLADAGRVLSQSLDYEETLAGLVRLAVPRIADWCALDMASSNGRIERMEVAHPDPLKLDLARQFRNRYPLDPNSSHPVAEALRTGRSAIFPEISDALLGKLTNDPEHLAMLRSLGMKSAMIVPIKARHRILGALSFGFAESGRSYSESELALAENLAVRAGLAVDNALLYRAAQQEIAERKQAEQEVQKLNLELEERVERRTAALQESNEQLQAFSYTVAHDLRAPLRAMQGFSQALLEDYSPAIDTLGQDYLRRVVEASQRMDSLIQDLLAYSRLSQVELAVEPVRLETAIELTLLIFAAEIRQKRATISVESAFPSVLAHPITIEQILANLLSNALKFTAPDVDPRIRIWAEQRGSAVRLWIQDNGIGIAPEHQDRIFGVFERLHGADTFPGTGIGLAIVRKGVERMGGCAGLDSQPGKGSRFWIELPISRA
jgi:PAS domain S-box-containing protein